MTVITRPHRFGKTLFLKTVEHFFSCGKSDQAALFDGLKVWRDDAMRPLAGTKPVNFLSFGDLKPVNATEARLTFKDKLKTLLSRYTYLYTSPRAAADVRRTLETFNIQSSDVVTATILRTLCLALTAHHGEKPMLLLDEYDALLEETERQGFWDAIADLIVAWFKTTFQTNDGLDRALCVGIMSVHKRLMPTSVVVTADVTTPRCEITER